MAFLIGGANSAADTGFSVDNSCRFNAGDGPSMSRDNGTPTDVDKYTFSVWVKRADIGASNSKIFSIGSGGSGEEKLEFNTDDLIWRKTAESDGSIDYQVVTDRKFRDPSAWYHICLAYDSSDGTAGDRMKMYINGVRETSFSASANPDSNENSYINASGNTIIIGALHSNTSSQNAGAYFAEMVFIDGSALAPTSFGEFNEDSPNIWQPIDVSGLTFGTNGTYLDFEASDNLGNDKNGGTDFSESNLAATDQCQDSPSNNFATLNSIDGVISISDYAFTEGNCKVATGTNSNKGFARSTIGVAAGKWYMEFKLTSLGEHGYCGISNNACQDAIGETMGVDTLHNVYEWAYKTSGTYLNSNTNTTTGTSYGDSFDTGDIIGIALNLDDNELKFYKNNAVQASGTAIDITAIASNPTGFYFFACGEGASASATTWEANFGNPSYANTSDAADANGYGAFEYAPPSGYLALCTKNLAEEG